MARLIRFKARFRRAFRRLSPDEQGAVDTAIRQFADFLLTGALPAGLGLKKLGGRTYEFRAGLRLRIVYQDEGEVLLFVLVGNHEDVRRFLREA